MLYLTTAALGFSPSMNAPAVATRAAVVMAAPNAAPVCASQLETERETGHAHTHERYRCVSCILPP